MARNNEDLRDDITEQSKKSVSNTLKSGKKIFSKLRKKNNPIKKAKRLKQVGQAIAKLIKAIIAIIKAVISLLISLWWVVLIVAVLAVLCVIGYEILYNETATNGYYTENEKIKEKTGEVSLENSMMLMFYTKYSTHSYYYTVEDDSTIKQATSNQEITDFENRDSMFALSPGMLYIFDKYLNEGNVEPGQFTKPIYNTCSTGESVDGYCALKELTDEDGNVQADSVKYKEIDNEYYQKVEGKTEKGVWNWGLAPILHYKKFDQESQVQNYKATSFQIFDREEGVRTISSDEYAKMSDKEKANIKDLFGDILNRVESVPSTVEEGDSEDNGEIPEDDTAYAVDNVASFFGTITNSLSLSWVYQNDYVNTNNPVSWEKWYDDATSKEIENTDLLKEVSNGYISAQGYKVKYINKVQELIGREKEACEKEADKAKEKAKKDGLSKKKQQKAYDDAYTKCATIGGYEITRENGSKVFIEGSKKSLSVKVLYKADLYITRTGQLMKHTVTYDDDEPNLSETGGLDYLTAYIANYKTFVNYVAEDDKKGESDVNGISSSKDDEYYCKTINDISISNSAAQAFAKDSESLEDLWSKISLGKLSTSLNSDTSNITTSSSTQLYTNTGSPLATITQKVQNPKECAKNTIAIKVGNKNMKKFYANDLPNLQTLAIAKELGYNAYSTGTSISTSSAMQYSTIAESGINSDSNNSNIAGENSATELIKQKYAKEIKSAATTYGIDINLLYAIIEVTSGGDENFNTNKCTSSGGCGLMGIKTNNFEGGKKLTAYNFTKEKEESFEEAIKNNDGKGYMDVKNNITYGAMLLQRYMRANEYNHLLAIQAYNYGTEVFNKFKEYYTKVSGATYDYIYNDTVMYDWTSYREYCASNTKDCFGKKSEWGDSSFIEKVLSSFGTVDTISIRDMDKNYQTLDFSFLKNVNNSANEAQLLNNRIMNTYLRKGGDSYWGSLWNVMYAGQKSFDDGRYTLHNNSISEDMPKYANMIEYANSKSEIDVESVIYTAFGFNEALPIESYQNLSEDYWKTKYAAMFKTAGSKAWSSTYDISRTFNDSVKLPVNSPVITDAFGWKIREVSNYSYSDTSSILATQGEKVVSLSSGKVIAVNNSGESTVVTIEHNDGSGKIAENEDKNTEEDKDEEKSEITTNATSVTGTWKDIKEMGMTKSEVIEIIKNKFTDLKPNSAYRGKAKYFVDYCEKMNVNPFLIAAISAQESGYGTSELAINANNFGGMKSNHEESIGAYGAWAIFPDVETGIRAHINLLAKYYIHAGLYLPSTMAEKYCEGSSSWVIAVNSIYSTISGHIYEEATQAKKQVVKKYVSFTYYDLANIQVKEGDVVKSGDVIGYVGEKNIFKMSFNDDNKETDISAIFKAIEDSRAREKAFLSIGGIMGSNNIDVDITTPSFTSKNPYSYVGQCTWYVWGRVNQVTDVSLPQWGNAQDWCSGAQASGYKTSSKPSVNAVAVWSSGIYGHVAFVEEYDGTNVTLTEGNYNNPCAYAANNCDMVAYAAANPGSLLHKVTLTEAEVKTYNGMNLTCYVFTGNE